MLKPMTFEFSSDEMRTIFHPIEQMDVIGLAVSGGVDSLGLMLLVSAWRKLLESPPRVCVFTVNHGLRPEALAECEFVDSVAKDLGFDCTILHWVGQKPITGIQAAARAARYVLMGQAMGAEDIEILLSGHHAQDQAETVLMRLAHGSGMRGLASMRDFSIVHDISIFRPLLNIPKSRLEAIVCEAGLSAMEDPSNQNPKYERVRWRKILPKLEDMGLQANVLGKFAHRMARANDALDEISNQLLLSHCVIDQVGMLKISYEEFIDQPAEIALRLLSKMVYIASGRRKNPELAQLEKLQVELFMPDFSGVVIGGCAVHIWRNYLVVFREIGRQIVQDLILVPEENVVWDQRFDITNNGTHDIQVLSASALSHSQIPADFQHKLECPIAALRAAPLVKNHLGEIISLGALSLDKSLHSSLLMNLNFGAK